MGMLVDGKWQIGVVGTKKGSAFERPASSFRETFAALIEKGVLESGPLEKGRFHLIVSYACPWAHRTLIGRHLKGLDDVISVSVVEPHMGEEGWTFDVPEQVTGARKLHEVYTKADARFTGKVTVPVLWDKQRATIVNNESSEVLRMFDDVGTGPKLYPLERRPEIDAINDRVYPTLNNGVYRCGFAGSQKAYDDAIGPLFETLDWLEAHLATRRYLVGSALTEADIRLFTTLVRFDAVYVTHFKCNRARLADYPHLSAYTRDLYQQPAFQETVHLDHIKVHYFTSHPQLNPQGIIPEGFVTDFAAPHARASLP